jgi:hypothetical protein
MIGPPDHRQDQNKAVHNLTYSNGYFSVSLKVQSSRLLPKSLKIKIYEILPVVVYG